MFWGKSKEKARVYTGCLFSYSVSLGIAQMNSSSP